MSKKNMDHGWIKNWGKPIEALQKERFLKDAAKSCLGETDVILKADVDRVHDENDAFKKQMVAFRSSLAVSYPF